MKGLRIGRRRGRTTEPTSSPIELALVPALKDERWHVPDHFNFTRDVVEPLAANPKRRALTCLGKDGVIEPRSFMQIAEGAARWASILREHGVRHEDRVVVLARNGLEWLEVVLGVMKAGAITVPCAPTTTAAALEVRISATEPALLVAERSVQPAIEQMTFTADVHYLDEDVTGRSADVPDEPTHNTSSRDLAFIFSTPGTAGESKGVAHTHASVFATRVAAEHWLDAGPGDSVWCPVPSDSAHAVWNALAGPWSRGAEVVLDHGEFDPRERLDLLYRLAPTIVCQSPSEYKALAGLREFDRFRSPTLRRLVSTGDYLEPEIVQAFEERWGMTIHDGYGQTETNIVVANSSESGFKPGSLGHALPGHHVAIIDAEGNELPVGIEGDLAVRGRPPTLFAGYWEAPEETKAAFRGDWYVTGDVAKADEEGFFWFVGRAEDVISSSGRTFGPYDVERVLREHPSIAASAVVGLRDLQRGGQFVRAYVVPAGRVVGTSELEVELRQFVGEALPEQQVPREIVFVDELPTVRGQVSRHLLREHPVGGRPLWEDARTPTPEAAQQVAAAPPQSVVAEAAPAVDPEPPAPPAPVPERPPVEPSVTAADARIEPVSIRPEEPELVTPEIVAPVEPVAEAAPEALPELAPLAEAGPEQTAAAIETTPLPEYEPDHVPPTVVPEPEPEPIVREPEPVAEAAPAPEPATPELLPEPEPMPVDTTELSIAPDPEPLPDYVIEPSDDEPQEPPARPAPEPVVPIASEPLPDFIIPPGTQPDPPPRPPEPEPEEEAELGPLPDYVVDPSRPREPRLPEPEWSAPLSEPKPLEEAAGTPGPESKPALQFPSATSFPTPRSDGDGEPEFGRDAQKSPRGGSAASRPRRPRSREAEPGDEGDEVTWMAGLSGRLSAYSLSGDETSPPSEPSEDESEDADTPD